MSVILVTGSSTGIGQETALHMARKGHDVYAAVRSPDTATELKEKIGAESLPITVIKLDLVDPASIETAVKAIMQRSGRIDALVNNAGIGGGRAVEETEIEEVREIFETNYFGNVNVLRAVTPIMREAEGGQNRDGRLPRRACGHGMPCSLLCFQVGHGRTQRGTRTGDGGVQCEGRHH